MTGEWADIQQVVFSHPVSGNGWHGGSTRSVATPIGMPPPGRNWTRDRGGRTTPGTLLLCQQEAVEVRRLAGDRDGRRASSGDGRRHGQRCCVCGTGVPVEGATRYRPASHLQPLARGDQLVFQHRAGHLFIFLALTDPPEEILESVRELTSAGAQRHNHTASSGHALLCNNIDQLATPAPAQIHGISQKLYYLLFHKITLHFYKSDSPY